MMIPLILLASQLSLAQSVGGRDGNDENTKHIDINRIREAIKNPIETMNDAYLQYAQTQCCYFDLKCSEEIYELLCVSDPFSKSPQK